MRYHNLYERKTSSLSNAYWLLPFIMIFRNTVLIRRRLGTEYAGVDAYNSINIVTTGIIILVLLSKRHQVVAAVRDSGAEIKYIIAYYIFAVLSGTWSSSLAYTSYRATEFLVNFIEGIKNNPLRKAILAHLGLVTIHPFVDGNGRCARLLMNLIILNSGYPIIVVKKERRGDYLNALEVVQKNPKDKKFLMLMLEFLQENFNLYKELY